jgi:hypothetical protein
MSGSTRRWPARCLPAVVAIVLSACNGNGAPGTATNSLIPPASQAAGAFGVDAGKLHPVNTYPGAVIGEAGIFHPKEGDTKAGGHGSKVDGIPCDQNEYLNDYHVHAYLGIVYHGKQVAIPPAIGLIHPGPKENGYITTAGCFYFIHTHDASGIVHVEDKKNFAPTATVHPFGDVLDIWGVKLTSDTLGDLKGPVSAYVGNESKIGQLTVNSYTKIRVDGVRPLKIRSHEVLWLVVDSPGINARKLPPVTFYMEY